MFSRSAAYGIRAMVYLAAQDPDSYVPIHEISRRLEFSHAFLTKVLQQLNRAGLLRSQKGPHGGVALSRDGGEISIGDVIEAIDGSRLFTNCILGLPRCSEDQPCALHDQWAPIRGQLEAMLSDRKIGDATIASPLARRPDPFSTSKIRTTDS